MGAHFVIFDEASGGEVDMDFCPGQLGRILNIVCKALFVALYGHLGAF